MDCSFSMRRQGSSENCRSHFGKDSHRGGYIPLRLISGTLSTNIVFERKTSKAVDAGDSCRRPNETSQEVREAWFIGVHRKRIMSISEYELFTVPDWRDRLRV